MTSRSRGHGSFQGVVSGLMLTLALCALALAGYETSTGRWHATPVLSGSMRPGLQPGDVVLTERVPISDLRVRDVVVFHPPNDAGRQRVHRIVKLQVSNGTTIVTTRGDANTVDDPLAASLGGSTAYRVERVVPLVGYPAVWLDKGNHGALAIALGLLLLVSAVVTALRPEKSPHDVESSEAARPTAEPPAPDAEDPSDDVPAEQRDLAELSG